MAPVASHLSRVQRSRALRMLVAVFITVPLVASAIYMWMMWDPTETVGDMPVAIVDNDRPVGQGPQRIHAGADVARNLVETKPLGFHLVDARTADAGLANGDYYFVVEIPETFSSTLSLIGSSTVAPALITVRYNDNNTLKASSIGAAAMSQINAAVLRGVSSTTVGTLVDGVDDLGQGLRQAADGSGRLADGTDQLSTGLDQLSTGLGGQLAPGMSQAADGGRQLAAGSAQLATGLTRFRDGTDQLGAGATQLADGIDTLVGGLDIRALKTAVAQAEGVLPPGSPALAPLRSQLTQVTTLVDGLEQLRQGSRQIATELTDPAAPYRGGLEQLVTGGRQLDAGAASLSDGLGQLDSGVRDAVDGVVRLQDGSHRLRDGAGQLDDGLRAGTQGLPDLQSPEKRASLAELLSTPVTSDQQFVARAQFFGPGAAPTLLIVASALVVIVVFMSFRAHDYVAGSHRTLSWRTMIRRAVAVTGISLAVMAALGVIVWHVLTPSPDPASLGQVIVVVAAATVMNVAVTSLLFTLFGYAAGALTSLAWMMLQLFSYGGVWMVETLPAPFRWLHPVSPMTYFRDGLIAAFNGAEGFSSALTWIVGIAVSALAINLVVCRIARRAERTPAAADDTAAPERTATEQAMPSV
ncbi:YhgE/Pip family protein [Gordonia sp. NPDC003376]